MANTKDKSKPGFEYMDHTADIQFHAWGPDLKDAFEQVAIAMFGYMCDLKTVEIDEKCTFEFEIQEHDLESLLFKFLDEFLFNFCTEFTICKEIEIIELNQEKNFIKVKGKGEKYSKQKHTQGTEIKAITYSNMQIHQQEDFSEVFVIVDI